jgi:hypothetical protein
MSQITVFSELVFRADAARASIRALEGEIRGMASRVSATRVSIPVTVEDHASRAIRQIALTVTEMRPAMTVRLDTTTVEQQLNALRASVAANPIMVPVAGVAGTAAGAASPAGAVADASPGFFSGLFTRRGAIAALMAAHGLNRLGTELGEGTTVQKFLTGQDPLARIEDPMEQLKEMRRHIEQEHTGGRMIPNWLYGKLGLQPTYDEETARLDAAEQQMNRTTLRGQQAGKAASSRTQFRDLLESMGEDADAAGMGDMAKRREMIEKSFKKAIDNINKIDEAWRTYGVDYPEVQKVVEKARGYATRIRDAGMAATEAEQTARASTVAGRVEDIQERGTEAGLRSEGREPLANFLSRRASINRRIRELQTRFTLEETTNPSKARDTAKELEAEQDAAVKEHAANLREYRKALRAERRKIQDVQTQAESLTLTTGGRPGEGRLLELRQNIESQIEAAEGNPALQAALAQRGVAQLEAERKRLRGEPRLQGLESLGGQLLTAGFRQDNIDDRSSLEARIDEMEQRLRAVGTASSLDAQFRALGFNLGLSETLGFSGQGGSPFGDAPEKLDEAGTKLSAAGDKFKDVLDRATHIVVLDTA